VTDVGRSRSATPMMCTSMVVDYSIYYQYWQYFLDFKLTIIENSI
jgi:hypothetical protein